MTLDSALLKIDRGERFCFTRWGDGELACLSGKRGKNCDGHPYTPKLMHALRGVLASPQEGLHYGLQDMGARMFPGEVKSHSVKWTQAGIFHTGSVGGRLKEMASALRRRDTIMVGPKHLEKLDCYSSFVRVPGKDAFGHIDRIEADAKKLLTQDSQVIAISMGPGANVLAYRLYMTHRHATVINFGSLWDPLVGVKSRNYHKKLKIR